MMLMRFFFYTWGRCAGGNLLGNGTWLNVGGNQAVTTGGKSFLVLNEKDKKNSFFKEYYKKVGQDRFFLLILFSPSSSFPSP